MAENKRTLLVFDFDGVLAIPYTDPEEHFDGIPSLIQECAKHADLAVASYNPLALRVVSRWGLDRFFVAGRAGYDYPWKGVYNEAMRECMSKHEMIRDMTLRELIDNEYHRVVFFDDDERNFKKIHEKAPHIKTELIDWKIGLQREHIEKHLSLE
jgi:hypothetical protein